MLFSRRIYQLVNLNQIVKHRSLCVEGLYSSLAVGSKFTQEDQYRLLNTLNSCDKDELSNYSVSKVGIRNLESWKVQKGPFKSLDEVLEVDGLSINVLKRICKKVSVSTEKKVVQSVSRSRRQYLTPALDKEKALNSAVGINLALTGVSWAKLKKSNNELESWGFRDFSTLPKKMTTSDTFHLVTSILNDIPVGEVYVFEGMQNSGGRTTVMSSYIQHVELVSMLFALISTSAKHKQTESDETSRDVVYYLKANVFPRLFNIYMGNERVSTGETVHILLNSSRHASDFQLPCSPVNVNLSLKDYYNFQRSNCQELLGQALLLIVTFMDLCVYKNPISYIALTPNKKNSDKVIMSKD